MHVYMFPCNLCSNELPGVHDMTLCKHLIEESYAVAIYSFYTLIFFLVHNKSIIWRPTFISVSSKQDSCCIFYIVIASLSTSFKTLKRACNNNITLYSYYY